MPNYEQSAKHATKAAKQLLISSICNEIDNVKESNNGIIKPLKKLLLKRYECWKDRAYIQSSETELALVNHFEDGGNESGEEEQFAFKMT